MESLPSETLESLRAPLAACTVEAVSERLDALFPGRWEKSYQAEDLAAIPVRGLETDVPSLEGLPLMLLSCHLTLSPPEGKEVRLCSSVISPLAGDWTEQRLQRLSFLNTAVRELGLGLGKLKPSEISFGTGDSPQVLPGEPGDLLLDGATLRITETKANREDFEEKRKSPRKLLPLQNSVTLAVHHKDDTEEINAFLLDISRTGMRIITDYDFPVEHIYPLTLCIKEPVSLDALVTWKKNLWEGMYFVGFQFQQMISEDFNKVCRYLEGFRPDDRRKYFRLERDLLMELKPEGYEKAFHSLILDLSESGIKATYKGAALAQKTTVSGIIYMGFEEEPIDVNAETVWSKSLDNGISISAFKFIDMGRESQKQIHRLIEHCIITNLHEALGEITESK